MSYSPDGRTLAVASHDQCIYLYNAENDNYGLDEYGDKLPGDTAGESYVTSGNALWARATDEERRGVIEGFATNSTVCRVEMVNAFVSDALAQLWAAVLAKNATITSLVGRALQPLTSRPQCWRRVG